MATGNGQKRKKKGKKQTMAARADRHKLYQRAVQCVEAEIDFVDDTFTQLRGRKARVLREDFCGTANTACEWVRRRRTNRAIGVDIDEQVQSWGREHNLAKLDGPASRRIRLLTEDVLKVRTEPVDAVLAMNFSYWIFKERPVLRRYFRSVQQSLAPDGLFFLDAYGGYDAQRITKDRNAGKGFTYIWDQAHYNPITGDMTCHIHFKFPDGSRLQRAFSYDWRLWTLPEIREILLEARFQQASVYWQGYDEESNEANGIFEPTEQGEPDAAWIAYIVAEK